jgi:acyl carrier protein
LVSELELNQISAADDLGQRLREVMGAVFGIDPSVIAADASSATIAEWDSVRHLQLMLALEEEFNVQFEADELVSLRSVALIDQRLRASAS